MRQLEDLLGPEHKQLSEIIEEEREECDNGELLGGPSENKFTNATLDKGASRDGSNVLSSMTSQESKVKGMGSGIAPASQNEIAKESPRPRLDDCQTTFQLSQKLEDDASLEISKSQIIDQPTRDLGSVMRTDEIVTPVVRSRDQSELETARMSLSNCSEAGEAELTIELDENVPHLKPKDLEDLASIVDKIRILNKKKED